MLHGLRGRLLLTSAVLFLLAPHEAGEYLTPSGLFRAPSGPRMAQDGRVAPVLMVSPQLGSGFLIRS